MANQAVRLWEALLQSLTDVSRCGKDCNITEVIKKVEDLPAQPKATWKRLVQDMQVPRKLGLFASTQLMPSPYATGPRKAASGALIHAVAVLMHAAARDATPQVRSAMLRQMTEAGLFTCLDQLAEATAEQLEQCDVAAADSTHVLFQERAANLFAIQERMEVLRRSADPDLRNAAAVSIAAEAHLMVAAMQSLSTCLNRLQPQEDPPDRARHLAWNLAVCVIRLLHAAAVFCLGSQPSTPDDFVQSTGRHFVAWADIGLLLSTYACTLKQHGHLPAVGTSAGSSSGSSGGSGGSGGSSGSGGSGGSSKQHRRNKKKPQSAACVAAVAGGVSSSSSSSSMSPGSQVRQQRQRPTWWQEAQAESEHVPATHQQLLGLFGVSPQAAVWVALMMVNCDHSLPTPRVCWVWNPHWQVASLKTGQSAGSLIRAEALRLQLQQWSDAPLLELLQPVLLYGAAHAAADDTWSEACLLAAVSVFVLSQKGAQATAGSGSSSTDDVELPPRPDTVRDEMLLLTLNLLQRLQQLRTAGAGGGSSSTSSSAVAAKAEKRLTQQLVALGQEIQLARQLSDRRQSSSAAGAGGQQGKPSEGAPLTAEAVAVWQQQAGAICTALEGFVRATSSDALPEVQPIVRGIAGLCCEDEQGRPGLLQALVQAGSSEQQVAFFSLLVSLLKLTETETLVDQQTDPDFGYAGWVTMGAASMLTAFDAASGGRDGLVSLWLLLLGRCFLQCAAALQQVDGQGRGLVEVIEQILQEAASGGGVARSAFDLDMFSSYVTLCRVTHSLLSSLDNCSSGSSLSAGLSAARYDVGPIAQGLEALAACCVFIDSNELIVDQDMPSAVAEMVRGPPGLIQALVSAGHALSVFAVPHCCNNPGCSNTSGLSEASIVSGKGCICAGCKVARYCGKPCQVAHWKAAHKPMCRMLSARSAGTDA